MLTGIGMRPARSAECNIWGPGLSRTVYTSSPLNITMAAQSTYTVMCYTVGVFDQPTDIYIGAQLSLAVQTRACNMQPGSGSEQAKRDPTRKIVRYSRQLPDRKPAQLPNRHNTGHLPGPHLPPSQHHHCQPAAGECPDAWSPSAGVQALGIKRRISAYF